MIYWYTGQPGHGKSLHAIERAMDFVAAGRVVYACNVNGLDYEKTGMKPMTPDEFKDWPNSLPDGSVVLVDECYQFGMLAKQPPRATLPHHVDELARHRHRGLDFIFVSQSPSKQCHEFIIDLIEEQIHVRRLFGTDFVELKKFDRHESNPAKARALTTQRHSLYRKSRGLYKSTVLDTSEKRIPWYYKALAVGLVVVPLFGYYVITKVGAKLAHKDGQQLTIGAGGTGADGARSATAPNGAAPPKKSLRETDYIAWLKPRVEGQPWTAPAYDQLTVSREPPRVFCMSSGYMRGKAWIVEGCSCLTDQGTRFTMKKAQCGLVSLEGQYEPFLVRVDNQMHNNSGPQQFKELNEVRARETKQPYGSVASYGTDGLGAY